MTVRQPRGETATRATIIGVGVLALGWGLWLMTQQSLSDLLSAGAWFVIPAVLSDLLLLPIVAVVGAALTRYLQPWVRLPAQVALAMIGGLTFIALPFLTGLGKRSDNPSLLNRNYPLGLAAYILLILIVTGGWALARRRALRPRSGPAPRADPAAETTW